MTYYSERKSIKSSTAQPTVYKTGDRAAMERQFHLFCASAATNTDGNDVDSIEWGTIEQGVLERKVWITPAEVTEETPAEES
jgi:hypothetical protein